MELLRTYAPCVAAQVDLLEHVYTWQGEVVEIMGDGKYWNHARTGQNTGNHPDGSPPGDGVSSYALRDIAPGEELLIDCAPRVRRPPENCAIIAPVAARD